MKDVIEIPEGDYVLLSEEDVEREVAEEAKKQKMEEAEND